MAEGDDGDNGVMEIVVMLPAAVGKRGKPKSG
jgi:hypothetical protein